MRMWMVDPRVMCRQHLLGEHGELHKHRHNFVKQHSMSGRIAANCLEPRSMSRRHNELAAEMLARGFNHRSPFKQPPIGYLPVSERNHKVDVAANLRELARRCPDCAKRIKSQTKDQRP